MKFTTELLKKAWAIYGNIRKNNPKMSHRKAWSLALKDTIRFFKHLNKGIIEFIKMSGEIVKRRIAPLTLLGYETVAGAKSLFTVVDMDKVDQGEKNVVISFHNFQMI